MGTVTGRITIVQEDRFQLAGEDGRKRLFVLSHRAPMGIDDLQALERSRRRITVRCKPAAGLIGYVAERIVPADGYAP